MYQPAGGRIHGGLAQLRRVHFTQTLEALHIYRTTQVLGLDALEHTFFLALVQCIEHVFAHVDSKQRRHGNTNPASVDQRPKMPHEKSAQQGGDMGAIGVGVSQYAYLAVAQCRKIS